MTDRLAGVFVVFEKDIREDDAEKLLDAIRCIRNVLTVEPHVASADLFIAEMRARTEMVKKLQAVVLEYYEGRGSA